ncbi:hypothetical protein [uncultured Leifsonia sp.]|uniref:hypothetical protein n=1 Tax=uncultured Leifsonia sp. TaxID=340359 RepID=UPI0028D0BEB8|nr:hypothetical protein [uncultured Leifsonia sp.]
MSSRGVRVVRGLAAAGTATFVAALFHMAGGGEAPSVVAVTLSLVFSTLASIALAGKRMVLWRVTASVAVSQFLFHALFSLSPSASFSGLPAGGHVHAGMHLTLIPGAGAGADASLLAGDAAMWASHVAAALLTIAALRHGERAFWAVCHVAFFRLRRFVDLVTAVLASPATPRRAPIETAPATLPALDVVLGGMRHRGPPVGIVPAR